MAQKLILDKPKSILLKVVVADDYFRKVDSGDKEQPKSEDLAHYLATVRYDNESLVGLIGHQQPDIARKVSQCYEQYKLPALTTVIQSQSVKGRGTVQSLLPSTEEMAKKIIKAMGNAPEATSREKIKVFYDKNDLSSKELKDKICAASKESRYHGCSGYDITNDRISSDLINKRIIHDDEWFLAINPFDTSEENTITKGRIVDIINAYGNNRRNGKTEGRLYLGHNFIDEELVNAMNNTVMAAGSVALNDQYSRNADIWRFSPWDWRSRNAYESSSFNEYHKRYGSKYKDSLNWYTVTAFNSMLFFYEALDRFDNASSISPNDIRENLVGYMNQDGTYDLRGTIPSSIRISTKNKSLSIGGDGNMVCLVNMTNPKQKSKCD
ncbi:MAG: hypothetical protein ACKO2V_03735 [Snowella sp.]